MKIGVIGGSGFTRFLEGNEIAVSTGYGAVEATESRIKDAKIFFINRHGKNACLPHMINHHANISAFKKLGATRTIAISAVGSMNKRIKAGDFVLPDQFLDFTRSVHTFQTQKAVHVDVSEPFCPELRRAITDAARSLKLKLHPSGTYACVSGPRYETSAEIRAFKLLGGDVVGMTIAPECVLAREMGICYSVISLATNYAAGIGKAKLTHSGVIEVVARKREELRELISKAILEIPASKSCKC